VNHRFRPLHPNKQEAPFVLLLDVKDIPRSCGRNHNPLLGIRNRRAHGGIIPQTLFNVKIAAEVRKTRKGRSAPKITT
jgi:hypothetical protein